MEDFEKEIERLKDNISKNPNTKNPSQVNKDPSSKKPPIYTGNGDKGFTKNILGEKIPKNSVMIETVGKMDSLQAAIDRAILDSSKNQEDKEILEWVQERIWQSYTNIQDPKHKRHPPKIISSDLQKLEQFTKAIEKDIPRVFIRFKTGRGINLNECRVRCREVERSLSRLLTQNKLDEITFAFYNRLSSFFYAMCLKVEQRQN
jgi:cob(I)alamin adenosyltransferase